MAKRNRKGRVMCMASAIAVAVMLFTGCTSVLTGTENTSRSGDIGGNGQHALDKIDSALVESNSKFAFKIFRQLNKEDKDSNIFISPISISTALSMTRLGAGTSTKDAMSETLEYIGLEDATVNESYKSLIPYLGRLDKNVELYVSNSLWIREGEQIKENFISANRDIYNARVEYLDFSKQDAADTINRWISKATKKKIEKMIEPPVSPDVIMYIINAIYFKGEWKEKFDAKNTAEAPFYAGDGTASKAMMMSRNGKAGYMQGDGYAAVRLPYGSGKVAMYCILPDEGVSINDFIDGFDENRWKEIKEGIAEKDEVIIKLPRFKLEYGIKELNDSLIALGMGEAFSENADFSGIRNDVRISRVLHKAVIEVNEEGSEASAATVVEITEAAAVMPVAFIADRPFIFAIADDTTGTILFLGKLYDVG